MIDVSANGERVPALGLGTWQMTGHACRDAVLEALAIGYRHLDTAQMYDNEHDIGEALGRASVPRDELFITTKIAPTNMHAEDVRKSARASLERLAVDYVDLLLIHWPSEDVPLEETLGAMMELKDDQLVRMLGVSNFPPRHLDEARRIAPISCLQIEYHPFLIQTELSKMCRRSEIMLTAYCPLARGRVARDPVLKEIGRRHDKTAAQVALRWLVQQQHVAAIPKASSREHLIENFDIFDFELSLDEVSKLFELDRGERLIDPDWAPDWSAKPGADVRREVKRAPEGSRPRHPESQP